MKEDFNTHRERANAIIDLSVSMLQEGGDKDSDLNYLYFLKDDIKKKIRKVRRANRKVEAARKLGEEIRANLAEKKAN